MGVDCADERALLVDGGDGGGGWGELMTVRELVVGLRV